MKKYVFLPALAILALVLYFSCQKDHGPLDAPAHGTQTGIHVRDTFPHDTVHCVDSIRILNGFMGLDTCKYSPFEQYYRDSLCCKYQVFTQVFPSGTTGLNYVWTIQKLPSGPVYTAGNQPSFTLLLQNNGGINEYYEVCVTITKPGCPVYKKCRRFQYNSKNCKWTWIE